MIEVTGIYRGRSYVARLTSRGMWIVRCGGRVFVFPALQGEPAVGVQAEIERVFQTLPDP